MGVIGVIECAYRTLFFLSGEFNRVLKIDFKEVNIRRTRKTLGIVAQGRRTPLWLREFCNK